MRSTKGVSFLDMEVFKGPRFERLGILDLRPIVKNNGRFLNPQSAHPPSLHLAWPRAYLQRLWGRSTDLADYERAKRLFCQRLPESDFPKDVIGWISKQTNFIRPFNALNITGAKKCRVSCVWQPMEYHSFLAPKMSSALRNFLADPNTRGLVRDAFGGAFDLLAQFAWRLAGSPFGRSLIVW